MMQLAPVCIPHPQFLYHHRRRYLVPPPIATSHCEFQHRLHVVPVDLPLPGIIKQVWHENLAYEFMKIRNLLLFSPSERRCFLASVDTEFPGVVYASDKGRLHEPRYNYGKMKENVNATNIIQLGLTLSDRFGNFYTWEFNFSDFDIDTDDRNEDSIKLLKTHGIDFERNKKCGIPSSEFAKLCWKSGLVGHSSEIPLTWVGFQSSYDFGFFTKILTGDKLPDDTEVFMRNVKLFFGPSVFDIKHIISRLCAGVYGGLETVAKTVGVARALGKSHTAGSDSLLTLQTFIELIHQHVLLEPEDSSISSIETLWNFTMHMKYVNSRAPGDIDRALQIFQFLISHEDHREKENYSKLYSCQGALYSLASKTNQCIYAVF